MTKRAKQTGPYTVKWQGSLGYGQGKSLLSLEEAQVERDKYVQAIESKGYSQVKPGVHFYSNGQNWKSVTIVGSDDKYVKGA